MKFFGGKKGKQLIIILISLLVFVIGISVYFSIPIREGIIGSNTITNINDVMSLPGVGKNSIPSSKTDNWAMVNEIVEPDGTVVQDIVNTDGTVLTITNKQNVISGGSSGSGSSSGSGNVSGGTNSNSMTFNRNMF